MVGGCDHAPIPEHIGIVVLAAPQACGLKAAAKGYAPHRWNAEQRGAERRFQPAKQGVAQPRRQTGGGALHCAAHRVLGLPCVLNGGQHAPSGFSVQHRKAVFPHAFKVL